MTMTNQEDKIKEIYRERLFHIELAEKNSPVDSKKFKDVIYDLVEMVIDNPVTRAKIIKLVEELT
jgi:hypothetical protein